MPDAAQDRDGSITISLGAKGVVEAELVASGEKWGRGPAKDIHSSNRARVDSPAWHLVQALNTLIDAKGDPAIDGLLDKVKPISAADKAMLDVAAERIGEESTQEIAGRAALGARCELATGAGGYLRPAYREHRRPGGWLHRAWWHDDPAAPCRSETGSAPGPGHDLPTRHGREAQGTSAKPRLRRHRGQCDRRLRSDFDRRQFAHHPGTKSVYRNAGIDPIMWPRRGGSWPGYVFTGAPLNLAAAHHGLGHGARAHAPDEYYLIDSKNPKLAGMDGAVRSFVDILFALA